MDELDERPDNLPEETDPAPGDIPVAQPEPEPTRPAPTRSREPEPAQGRAEPVRRVHDETPMQRERQGRISLVLLCLLCAVIGATVGAFTVFFGVEHAERGQAEPAAQTTAAPAAQTTGLQAQYAALLTTTAPTRPEQTTLSANEVYVKNVMSCVSIVCTNAAKGTKSTGSGFIITADGYVLTNYHVVESGDRITAGLYDGSDLSATLVGFDEPNDIAVLRIQGSDLPAVTFGRSATLAIGDPVYVVGNPMGDLTFTLTAGVVSALNRLIRVTKGLTINMFQTDAAINSGNSGGPVFDKNGELVGIATAKYDFSTIEGLGFCIPIDDVKNMIEQIKTNGYVSGRAALGATVTDSYAISGLFFRSSFGVNGARIDAVTSGSAAANAGLQPGDVIVRIGTVDVTGVAAAKTAIAAYRAGDSAEVAVNRSGSTVTVTVTFDEYVPGGGNENGYLI